MADTQKNIYAKVDKDNIVEFPVTVETILARGHSVFAYAQVVFDEKPVFSEEIQTLSQVIRVQDGVVHVTYDVISKSLADLLASFKGPEGPRKVSELSELALQLANSLTSNHIENRIAHLAALRGYMSLNNVLGRYSNSSNPKYKKEAVFIQAALDKAWADLEQYFGKIIAGEVPVPTTIQEIDAVVVLPSWDTFAG